METPTTPAVPAVCQYCKRDGNAPVYRMTQWTDGVEDIWYCGECCIVPAVSESSSVEYERIAPESTETILDEIITFVRRFVVFADPVHYDILALWILHTYQFAHDAVTPYATPYIYVTSAEPQCGKTRTIEVAELLARNPKSTARMSPGALYAAIESVRPTVFLDEVDAIFSGKSNEDLRGMLNSGYTYKGNVELQTMVKGGERTTVQYSTFCPKLLAGIDNGELPATIADRCITFNLKRRKLDGTEEIERLNPRKIEREADELKSRISVWVAANAAEIAECEPADLPIGDRAFQIAEPLLQVGMRVVGWTQRSRDAIVHVLAEKKPSETLNTKALRMARELFADGDRDRITSAELAAAMDLTQAKASRLLTSYGIKAQSMKFHGSVVRGFYRADCADAFERYLTTE